MLSIAELRNSVVSVYDDDKFYPDIKTLWNEKLPTFNFENGRHVEEIHNGDYGYIELNNVKRPRLFLKTTAGRIEAFCMEHTTKCAMFCDVNKSKDVYFICGNLFI